MGDVSHVDPSQLVTNALPPPNRRFLHSRSCLRPGRASGATAPPMAVPGAAAVYARNQMCGAGLRNPVTGCLP